MDQLTLRPAEGLKAMCTFARELVRKLGDQALVLRP